jgi:hypothetical protein
MVYTQASTARKAAMVAATALLYTNIAAAAVPREVVSNSNPYDEESIDLVMTTSAACESDPKIEIETALNFRELVSQWKQARGAKSSIAEMAMLPAYQRIIGMGPTAIPFILAELQSEGNAPDHWFWALAAIAGENPVPAKSRGKLAEMANAWLEWGQRKGYVQMV